MRTAVILLAFAGAIAVVRWFFETVTTFSVSDQWFVAALVAFHVVLGLSLWISRLRHSPRISQPTNVDTSWLDRYRAERRTAKASEREARR